MSKRKIKNKKNIHYGKQETYFNEEFKKLAIIVGIVVLIFIVTYLIIGIFVTKEIKWFQKDTENETITTIQYKKILAGETFNQNQEEYYVIFSDSEKYNYPVYESLINNNIDKKIYIVDLANPLNKRYISDTGNSSVQNISDLKVKDDTLIKINNKTNVMYIEGKDGIIDSFK